MDGNGRKAWESSGTGGGIQRRLCSDQGEEWGGLLYRGGGFLEKGCLYFLYSDGNANDSVSSNNGLGVNGVTYRPGRVGKAFTFDGVNDYVTVPNSPSLNPSSGISVSAWVNIRKNNKYQIIVSKFYSNYSNGKGDDSYLLGVTPAGAIYWVVETLAGRSLRDNQTNSRPVNIFNNQFHHVVGTYDGENMKVYFDGKLMLTRATTGDIQASPNTAVTIGGGSNRNKMDWFINGQLDEVTLYSSSLSGSQVSKLYTDDKGACDDPETKVKLPAASVPDRIITGKQNWSVIVGRYTGNFVFEVKKDGSFEGVSHWGMLHGEDVNDRIDGQINGDSVSLTRYLSHSRYRGKTQTWVGKIIPMKNAISGSWSGTGGGGSWTGTIILPGLNAIGDWKLTANGHLGKLKIREFNGNLTGRIWFIKSNRWENLTRVRIDGNILHFDRGHQKYSAQYGGGKLIGTFVTLGRSYNWDATKLSTPHKDIDQIKHSGVCCNLNGEYAFTGGGQVKVIQSGENIHMFLTRGNNGHRYEFKGILSGFTIAGKWYSHFHKNGWFDFTANISPSGKIFDFSKTHDRFDLGINKFVVMNKALFTNSGMSFIETRSINDYMLRQENILRDKLRESGIGVSRDKQYIILKLPNNITFDTNSDVLKPVFIPVLQSIVSILKEFNSTLVTTVGHTDNVGSTTHNQDLSERRANSLSDYLTGNRILKSRLSSRGEGELQPVASNETDHGRALNRRVEVILEPLFK